MNFLEKFIKRLYWFILFPHPYLSLESFRLKLRQLIIQKCHIKSIYLIDCLMPNSDKCAVKQRFTKLFYRRYEIFGISERARAIQSTYCSP